MISLDLRILAVQGLLMKWKEITNALIAYSHADSTRNWIDGQDAAGGHALEQAPPEQAPPEQAPSLSNVPPSQTCRLLKRVAFSNCLRFLHRLSIVLPSQTCRLLKLPPSHRLSVLDTVPFLINALSLIGPKTPARVSQDGCVFGETPGSGYLRDIRHDL